jgi:pyruvate formate lyase activating enzyme
MQDSTGNIFEIQRFCIHDGQGIRTVIFFKGCPLRCTWCANPESQSDKPELFYTNNGCIGCGRCAGVCSQKAIIINNGTVQIDRKICRLCFSCVSSCPKKLFKIKGVSMTLETIMDIIVRDKPFFDASGGGITLSGGEPLSQPDFSAGLLGRAKKEGLSTCIETSLCVPFEVIERLIPLLDEILFDVKHWDSEKHRIFTGMENQLITDNIRKLIILRPDVLARIPIIPGFNDSEADIEKMIIHLRKLDIQKIQLLKYHNLALTKYSALSRTYPAPNILPSSETAFEMIRTAYRDAGFSVI